MNKNKIPEILLLGLPNSGKSTLINALTKSKTSIIGSKPNTTRDKVTKTLMYDNNKIINISTKSSENIYIDTNPYYSPYGPGWHPYSIGNYRRIPYSTSQGVLYIDVIDTKSKQLVWQGKGIGLLSSQKKNKDEIVEEYVNRILAAYPPEKVLINN